MYGFWTTGKYWSAPRVVTAILPCGHDAGGEGIAMLGSWVIGQRHTTILRQSDDIRPKPLCGEVEYLNARTPNASANLLCDRSLNTGPGLVKFELTKCACEILVLFSVFSTSFGDQLRARKNLFLLESRLSIIVRFGLLQLLHDLRDMKRPTFHLGRLPRHRPSRSRRIE